jgi:diguanylate cyclase (GGDEF)-like protein/PAS domain S-box-containing protein
MKKLFNPSVKTISTLKTVLIILVILGYVLLFSPLFSLFGRQAIIFYIFPTIIVAFVGGHWWGLVAGLLYAPLNLFLSNLVNTNLIDYHGRQFFWLFYLFFPVVGFALGGFRTGKDQLKKRLALRAEIGDALHQAEGIYRQIVENAIDAIMLIDLDGKITYVNEQTIKMHGFSREELVGKSFQFLGVEGEQEKTEQIFSVIISGNSTPVTFERMVRHKDSSVFHVAVNISLVTDSIGEPIYVQCMARHITQRKLVEEALMASEAILKKAQKLAHVGNWEWHLDDNAFWISEELCRIYGLPENDKFHEVHSFIQNTTHPDDLDKVRKAMRSFRSGHSAEQGISYRITQPNGEIRWVKTSAEETKSVDIDGNPTILLGMVQDITEQVGVEENLLHLATHDPLTGLPNRSLFYDRLNHAIARAKRDHTSLAILFLDLDSFKDVNDTFGHLAGDKLLKDVAERLQECVRESDTVARMSGDEFTIILENVEKRENTQIAVENIIAKLSKPYRVSGQKTSLSASIGVALFPEDTEDADEILQKADQAMYAVKNNPKKKKWYQFYEDIE